MDSNGHGGSADRSVSHTGDQAIVNRILLWSLVFGFLILQDIVRTKLCSNSKVYMPSEVLVALFVVPKG